MNSLALALSERAIAVGRFEFAYMMARRSGGSRSPPPRAERLVAEFAEAVTAWSVVPPDDVPLYIGGKSLGGRVASLLAASEEFSALPPVSGLCCLGYPFHPPKKPDTLRIAHLPNLRCPALIVQGERDPFGGPDEVASYDLPRTIRICWIGDGDHDLAPRARSGFTKEGNIAAAADAIADFISTTSESFR